MQLFQVVNQSHSSLQQSSDNLFGTFSHMGNILVAFVIINQHAS